MAKNLVIDVNENPKRLRDWFLFAIQHVLAMLVACITVPQITGLPIGATLVSAGVGTLIYIYVTKKKSPVFLSSSFAYLTPMLTALTVGVSADVIGSYPSISAMAAAGDANYLAIILGMAFVGLVYVTIALIIKKTGTAWLNKLLPPVVVGPIIMVIGLGLSGSAISNVTGGTYAISQLGCGEWYDSLISIAIALVACITTALVSHYGKKTSKLIPFVISMGTAYALALIVTIFGYAFDVNSLKVINFDMFAKVDWSSIEAWLNVGQKDWMFTLAANQTAEFNWQIVGQVAILFIPVAFVTVCEHIGDHKNLGNIIEKDLLNDEPGMTRTLIGDGVATAVSGGMCGAANTTYGENVAVVGVTKIASVNVIVVAALMSIVFGMFAPLTLVLQSVPACITGGVSLILYGFIASSGVKMLLKEHVDFGITRNIMIASSILVVGIGGLALKFGTGSNAITITSTALAMIIGIFLNAVLKEKPEEVTE